MEFISLLIFEVIFVSILDIQLAIMIENEIIVRNENSRKIKLPPKIIGIFHFTKKDDFLEISIFFSFVLKVGTSTFIAA